MIQEINDLIRRSDIPAVLSLDDYTKAGDIVSLLSSRLKNIKLESGEKTAALRDALQRVRAPYMEMEQKIEKAISAIKDKMLVFYVEEKKKREREQLLLEEQARKDNPEMDRIIVDDRTLVKTTHGAFGASTVKRFASFRVTNPADVPRQYLMIDEKKVRLAMKDNISIAGIDFFDEYVIAIC